ncbi:MAG: serine protease [Candidatus Caldarchaeum sp.]
MRKVVAVILALLLLGTTIRAGDSLRNRIVQSVFQVEWYTDQREIATGGNGFIVCDEEGDPFVGVTAYHVATDEKWQPLKMLQVKQYGVSVGIVEVFYHDTQADVALFRVPSKAQSCIPFAEAFTEGVTFYGSIPTGIQEGHHEKILWSIPYWGQRGEITSCCQDFNILIRNYIGDRWGKMILANLDFSPGHSGSPVVYTNGSLAGIAVGMLSRSNGAIIVPAEDVRAAIARAQAGAQAQAKGNAKGSKFSAPYFLLPKAYDR